MESIQEESISKLFRKNAVGMIIAAMAAMLGIVVDGTLISRFLGEQCMAAYGLVTPVVNLVTVFSGVLSTGTQIVCARHIGANDKEGARRVFSMCMLATIVLSVLMMLVFFFARNPICRLLGATGTSAELLPLSADYLLGLLFSIPAVLLLFEFNGLMRLDNDPNRIIVAVATMTILDIILDLANIFFFKMEMLGMGLATSVSYTIALVIMLLHFTKKDIIFRPTLRHLKASDLSEIVMTGSASAVGSASAMLRNRALNGIMLGTVSAVAATAALSVLNTVMNLTSCTMAGVGMTISMIAGIVSGKKDTEGAKDLVKVSIKCALLVGAVMLVILVAGAPLLARLFTSAENPDMLPLVQRAFRIYGTGMVLYALNTAFINYAQGMRKIGTSNIFCFLENCVFIVLPALLLVESFDSDAVWMAFVITEILTILGVLIFTGVKNKRLPVHAADYTFME